MHPLWNVYDWYDLSSNEKIVYGCLAKHQGNHEAGFPSHKLIAKECGISVSTVKRMINSLVKKGFVQKQRRTNPNGSNTTNLYFCEK